MVSGSSFYIHIADMNIKIDDISGFGSWSLVHYANTNRVHFLFGLEPHSKENWYFFVSSVGQPSAGVEFEEYVDQITYFGMLEGP